MDVIPRTIHLRLALEYGCRRDIVELLLLEARESEVDFQDPEILAWAEENASTQLLRSSLESGDENGEETASDQATMEMPLTTSPSTSIDVYGKKGKSGILKSISRAIRSSWTSAIRSQSRSIGKGQEEEQKEVSREEMGKIRDHEGEPCELVRTRQARRSNLPDEEITDGP